MNTISLDNIVSLSSVAKWPIDESGPLRFLITKGAAFEPFAEGVAIGVLGQYVRHNFQISLECTFDPLTNPMGGFFSSLFGTFLTQQATEILIAGDRRDSREVAAQIKNALWDSVRELRGEIGDGRRRSIVFRDPDYVIPDCIKTQRSEQFPLPSVFKQRLNVLSKDMGISDSLGASLAEQSLINFLYEASRNSHEHGRADARGKGIRGIRGVIIEKLIFASKQELDGRFSGSQEFAEYLSDIWPSMPSPRTLLCITVVDLGAGIQNTLPPEGDETGWQRLNRAIFTSASCKPMGDEVERGRGLPKIIEAADRLKAFLLVSSAELQGFCNYLQEVKYPKARTSSRWKGSVSKKSVGTSISFVWPILVGGGDQLSMLPDSL